MQATKREAINSITQLWPLQNITKNTRARYSQKFDIDTYILGVANTNLEIYFIKVVIKGLLIKYDTKGTIKVVNSRQL